MAETAVMPKRSEVPHEQTWDLESIFATSKEWDAAGREIEAYLPQLAAFQGRIGDGPETLISYLELSQKVGILAGKYFNYASNYYAVDTTNQQNAARLGQARTLAAQLGAANAFFEPELLSVGLERVGNWVQNVHELNFFSHELDKIMRKQAHMRSAEVEKVLAMALDPFSGPTTIYGALNNADLSFKHAVGDKGEVVEVGQASIGGLLSSSDRMLRKTAYENYNDAYLDFRNTLASVYSSQVKQDVFNARVRGYESSLHASLGPNNIPVEVFHNLQKVFRANLPTWHRYWRLRKEIMGLDEIQVYDLRAPLIVSKTNVPYEQAVKWICEGMSPLGAEVVEVLRKGCLEQRWVDRPRNRGKRNGAFTSATHGTYPFIMMSYNDDIFSLSTLAHELGHALHSYYSRREQPFIYGRYSLFEAEVASNFNQSMVRDYMFRTHDDHDFQVALIEEAMSNFHRYFFIMPMLARFEYETHTLVEHGEPVNSNILIGLMADLFKEGYGGEVVYDGDRMGIHWAQFGHMYMNFYVYQYTTGISGAHALTRPILAGDDGAVKRYMDFLKAGGSRYPIDNLKTTGVDLSKPEPVENAFAYLAGLIDRLQALLG